jgi:hypothetical protein
VAVTSDVTVTAVLVPAEWVDVEEDVTDAWITLDMGWTSNSSPSLADATTGSIWARNANLTVTLTPVGNQAGSGVATLVISGNGAGAVLSATGVDGYGNLFASFSTAAENSVVGTLAAGPSETSVRTLAGATATFAGGNPAFSSILTGNMTAFGGQQGFGAFGGDGTDGADGSYTPFPTPGGIIGGGAPGGDGGDGGGAGMTFGGRGGDGGYGGSMNGFGGGFYQGTVSVTVAQL